jgi:ABC-2 type transport system permease protein
VRAEFLKIWTTRTWWVMGLAAAAGLAVTLLINGSLAHESVVTALAEYDIPEGISPQDAADIIARHDLTKVVPRAAASLYTSGQYVGLLLVMILGILIATNEFSQQTATATFLAMPNRHRVVLAKIAAVGLFAGGLWLAITLVDLGVGGLVLSDAGVGGALDVPAVDRAILTNLLAYLLWAGFGVGLGLVMRSQTAAVLTASALYLVGSLVGQLIFILLYGWLQADWVLKAQVAIPTVASSVMITTDPGTFDAIATGLVVQPQWWIGLVIMLSWAAGTAATGTLITKLRDIS